VVETVENTGQGPIQAARECFFVRSGSNGA